jgi:endogenous inhibitor of DNA gyrase (YacG/DUF329 family)
MERHIPCPACRKRSEPRAQNPSFPFCSERCRLIDLGRWFGEEYRMPARTGEGEEQPPTPDDGSET